MTDLRLTPAAMKALYASTGAIVLSRSLVKKLASSIPASLLLVMLDKGGVLSLPSETNPTDTTSHAFIGMPAGLLGFVIKPEDEEAVRAFETYAARQKPVFLPDVLVIKGFGGTSLFLHFINQTLAARLEAVSARAGQAQHQLASVRQAHERAKTALNKAVRMMNGIGYGTRAVVYDLPVGDDAIPTMSDSTIRAYAQELPVDAFGLSAISLYVSDASGKEDADGQLVLSVRGASDGKSFYTATSEYTAFHAGWHRFVLHAPITNHGGECALHLSWSGAGGPRFSLTSVFADRFGDGCGRSLAMRLEKSIMPVDGLLDSNDADLSAVDGSMLATVKASGTDVFDHSIFYGGSALEQSINARNGWPVLSVDAAEGWLQTHLLTDDLSGVHMQSVLGVAVKHIGIDVHLAHEKAAPCLAFLIAADPDAATHEDTRAFLQDLGENGTLDTHGSNGGLVWSAAVLHAGDTLRLELPLELPLKGGQARDMILLAKPLNKGKADFGWCQWNGLSIGYMADKVGLLAQKPDMMRSIRAVSFPEIADRIEFYRGRYEHNKLRLNLGFMPIQVHHEFDAMQVNPLKGQICAAELIGGIPENTMRIACEVGTAHKDAARFIYILGLVPSGCADRVGVIEDIAKRVIDGTPVGCASGTCWTSLDLPALVKRDLFLTVPQDAQAGDIPFFCVVPSDGNTSFGWCRWYSLSFETPLPETHAFPSASPVDDSA